SLDTLAPVADVVCSAGDGVVDLTWTNPVPYQEVIVTRSVVGSDLPPVEFSLDGAGSTFQDRDLALGTYHYQVSGVAGSFRSPPTPCGSDPVIQPLPPVVGLSCGAATSEVQLSWGNPRTYDAIELSRRSEATGEETLFPLAGATQEFDDTC